MISHKKPETQKESASQLIDETHGSDASQKYVETQRPHAEMIP